MFPCVSTAINNDRGASSFDLKKTQESCDFAARKKNTDGQKPVFPRCTDCERRRAAASWPA